MQCPFLRKMNVKFCDLCRMTKIPLSGVDLAAEQCSGPDYRNCSLVRKRQEVSLPEERCPFLSVEDVHYCEVAPFQKLIPCNRTTVSRCMDDGHKYCQFYLGMVEADGESGSADVIPMPESLAYAPNHMWLDRTARQTCHLGVDAFFGHALGRVDEVIYPQHGDNRRPMVRFRVGDVDFDLVFPHVMQGIEINAHLVSDPGEVLRDPYGRGWIFEGVALPAQDPRASRPLDQGLLRGEEARSWMNEECDRLARFAHEHLLERCEGVGLLQQDGGRPAGQLALALDRRTLVRLHSEFFNFCAERTGS